MPYLFVVSMDVAPEKEALFNEVYDQEHVPFLLKVPGVRKVTRAKSTAFAVAIGGERKEAAAASPSYVALYEVESPDVLASPEWAAAVEQGRWPGEVRPHTTNRSHACYEVTGEQGG